MRMPCGRGKYNNIESMPKAEPVGWRLLNEDSIVVEAKMIFKLLYDSAALVMRARTTAKEMTHKGTTQ